jgi:hypothetical protein
VHRSDGDECRQDGARDQEDLAELEVGIGLDLPASFHDFAFRAQRSLPGEE